MASQRRARPWDDDENPSDPKSPRCSSVPYIEVDGARIYANQIYYAHELPRSKLPVNPQCLIWSTFSFDASTLLTEFSSFIKDKVPGLVLHGHRGWIQATTADEEEDASNSVSDHGLDDDDDDDSIDAHSLNTQPSIVLSEQPLIDIPDSLTICQVHATAWDATTKTPVSTKGVHHPKYLLSFEPDALLVMISTANLVPQFTLDAHWCQRFPKSNTKSDHPFGRRLRDFVRAQVRAADDAAAFVTAHLQSCDALLYYDYSAAQVALIPHIPAIVPSDDTRYGPQCLQQVLRDQSYAPNDRIIVQPTSFGIGWEAAQLMDTLAKYWGDEDVTIDELQIFWPERDFVQQSHHRSSSDTTNNNGGGFLFLSSDAFNAASLDCLSRWAPYRSEMRRVPHIKTYARVDGASGRLRWCLLTSACWSRGAQGEVTDEETILYRNFELGVLFVEPSFRLPYDIESKPYADEESLEFQSMPYFHEIKEHTGNMILTPYGRSRVEELE